MTAYGYPNYAPKVLENTGKHFDAHFFPVVEHKADKVLEIRGLYRAEVIQRKPGHAQRAQEGEQPSDMAVS